MVENISFAGLCFTEISSIIFDCRNHNQLHIHNHNSNNQLRVKVVVPTTFRHRLSFQPLHNHSVE